MKKLILLSFVLLGIGCNNAVTIADLFDMPDCTGPCYEQMPCEGEEVTVKIPLDGSNVLKNGHMLFIKDELDLYKTIKVEFGPDVSQEVQDGFLSNVGKTVYVSGRLEGYDLSNPKGCKRAHLIFVANDKGVKFK
jgi:hypothetical protein